MPRGAPRGGGPFVPRGGNFLKRAGPRGIPPVRSRGGFVPRRPTGIAPARGRGRARGGPDAPRGPGGPLRGRGGRARGRGRGGNSFFDPSENNYPDRVYVEEVLEDESRGGYGQESKVRFAFSRRSGFFVNFIPASQRGYPTSSRSSYPPATNGPSHSSSSYRDMVSIKLHRYPRRNSHHHLSSYQVKQCIAPT